MTIEDRGYEQILDEPTGAQWEHPDPTGLPGKLKNVVGLRVYRNRNRWEADYVMYNDFGQTEAQFIGAADTKRDAVELLERWIS